MSKSNHFLAFLGTFILLLVLIYLILKIIGVFHSPGYEEVLSAVIIGQVFYNGYTYRAVQGLD